MEREAKIANQERALVFVPTAMRPGATERKREQLEADRLASSVFNCHGPRQRWRIELWEMLQNPTHNVGALVMWLVIVMAILVSTVAMLVASVFPYHEHPRPFFVIETICIAIFVLELCLRVVAAPQMKTLVRDPMLWIDVLAILPYFIELLTSALLPGFSSLRVLRLARALRLLKLNPTSVYVLAHALRVSVPVLQILFVLLCVMLTLFGTLIWFAERGAFNTYTRSWNVALDTAWCLAPTVRERGAGYDFQNKYPVDQTYVDGCRLKGTANGGGGGGTWERTS